MTLDEATAALAADPAAVVWAGRDFDDLAATVTAFRDPEPTRQGQAYSAIQAARKAIDAAADMPARLLAIKDGIAALAAILAWREKAKADAAATIADRERRAAENWRAQQAATAMRERIMRATHPAFVQLKARMDAGNRAVIFADSPAALATALDALAADCAAAVDTLRGIGATILPAAA